MYSNVVCLRTLAAGGALLAAAAAPAEPLTLLEAERLGLADAPTVNRFEREAERLDHLSVAAGELPDPQLKLGVAALPLDTFSLSQEPMTQLQLGVRQAFPRSRLRGHAQTQAVEEAAVRRALAADERLRVLKSIRHWYVETYYFERALADLAEARALLEELSRLSRDSFATGRARQQDVYRADLELARLDERQLRLTQGLHAARGQLAIWIGAHAARDLAPEWPTLAQAVPGDTIVEMLPRHPRVRALYEAADAAEAGLAVAREQKRPGWALDVTYGKRQGSNTDGSDRADFISAMVAIDLPLFPEHRQNPRIAAAQSQVAALSAERAALIRELEGQVTGGSEVLIRIAERVRMFDDTLLPQAALNHEASLLAYQSGVGPFSDLVRARLTEVELILDRDRLRADALQTRARLLYLAGESS